MTFSFTASWTKLCMRRPAAVTQASGDGGCLWMSLVCYFRVYATFLAVQRPSFPQKVVLLFTASDTASLPPPHPLPDSTKLEREGEPACVNSALGQLAAFVSAFEACTALALGRPLSGGLQESLGACEQRQVKGTEPREGTRGCEHSALPTAARCVTLNLQRGRTSARLASLPARQASPTVPWLPFRVLAGGGGRDRSSVRQEVVDLLSTFFKSGMFSRSLLQRQCVGMATVKVRMKRC